MNKQPVTQRDEIEAILLEEFSGLIHPLDNNAVSVINQFKNGNFARSLLGYMLYTNGYNLRGTSHHYPNGLYYSDGEHLFGIGIFKKTMDATNSHIMIVCPTGDNIIHAVDDFLNLVYQLFEKQGKTSLLGDSFVRHLDEIDYRSFRRIGYETIDVSPWDPEAPAEDEEKNHKLIFLKDIIHTCPDSGELTVKALNTANSRNFRMKARMAYKRFENFLARNHLTFEIRDYHTNNKDIAEQLVVHHFQSLKNPVGSTPEDYFNIVRYQPDEKHTDYFGKMGYLTPANPELSPLKESIPMMLFIGEKTAKDTLALYATFALRDTDVLPENTDTSGFSAISQYVYLSLFKDLIKTGIKRVNVGGSETDDLDKFKRQLGAKYEASYWAVKTR